jgi:hypothetical protein
MAPVAEPPRQQYVTPPPLPIGGLIVGEGVEVVYVGFECNLELGAIDQGAAEQYVDRSIRIVVTKEL